MPDTDFPSAVIFLAASLALMTSLLIWRERRADASDLLQGFVVAILSLMFVFSCWNLGARLTVGVLFPDVREGRGLVGAFGGLIFLWLASLGRQFVYNAARSVFALPGRPIQLFDIPVLKL